MSKVVVWQMGHARLKVVRLVASPGGPAVEDAAASGAAARATVARLLLWTGSCSAADAHGEAVGAGAVLARGRTVRRRNVVCGRRRPVPRQLL